MGHGMRRKLRSTFSGSEDVTVSWQRRESLRTRLATSFRDRLFFEQKRLLVGFSSWHVLSKKT